MASKSRKAKRSDIEIAKKTPAEDALQEFEVGDVVTHLDTNLFDDHEYLITEIRPGYRNSYTIVRASSDPILVYYVLGKNLKLVRKALKTVLISEFDTNRIERNLDSYLDFNVDPRPKPKYKQGDKVTFAGSKFYVLNYDSFGRMRLVTHFTDGIGPDHPDHVVYEASVTPGWPKRKIANQPWHPNNFESLEEQRKYQFDIPAPKVMAKAFRELADKIEQGLVIVQAITVIDTIKREEFHSKRLSMAYNEVLYSEVED